MRVFFALVISTVVYFSIGYLQAAEAAVLRFDPTTSTSSEGSTFQVGIVIDAGTEQVAGSDAHILYDPTMLEPQSVSSGLYLPIVTNAITSGKVSITGLVENASQYATGTGTLATVTFKALKTGSGSLTFYCDTTDVDSTSKIVKNDFNATNIIECGALGTNTYTIGTGDGTANPTAAPTPTGTLNSTQPTVGTGTQLPASGIMDNMRTYSFAGVVFVALGLAVKMFLKV